MFANRRSSGVSYKIGFDKYEGDVRLDAGSRNMAIFMKNIQYNPYLWTDPEILVIQKIRVEEHDSDVRFQTGIRNMTVRACVMKNMHYNPYFKQIPKLLRLIGNPD